MMRSAAVQFRADARFDMPPLFVVAERRMAGRALDRWHAEGGGLVSGFEDNSVVVVDPAGAAVVESAGASVAAVFGIGVGMRLDGRAGLAAEIRSACGLIALHAEPVPFEASLSAPGSPLILARGIALPIGEGRNPDHVQIIVSWREVLDRAATTRLQRELGAALRVVRPNLPGNDPFSPENAR